MKKSLKCVYIFGLLVTLQAQQPVQAVFGIAEGIALMVGAIAAYCCTKKQSAQFQDEQARKEYIKEYAEARSALYGQLENNNPRERNDRVAEILLHSPGTIMEFKADGSEEVTAYDPPAYQRTFSGGSLKSLISLDFDFIRNSFLDNVFPGKKLSTKKELDSSKVLKVIKRAYSQSCSSNSRTNSRLSDSSAFCGYQTVSSGYDSDDEAGLNYLSQSE